MVDFELSPELAATREQMHMLAEHGMRPIAREYDENEHGEPRQFWETMWQASQSLFFNLNQTAIGGKGSAGRVFVPSQCIGAASKIHAILVGRKQAP